MSGSIGDRKPPRPRIEVIGPASPTEAAAVVAAVEPFLAATPAAARRSQVNPSQRAALLVQVPYHQVHRDRVVQGRAEAGRRQHLQRLFAGTHDRPGVEVHAEVEQFDLGRLGVVAVQVDVQRRTPGGGSPPRGAPEVRSQ